VRIWEQFFAPIGMAEGVLLELSAMQREELEFWILLQHADNLLDKLAKQ
jgi:hypothetical protein